MEEFLRFNFNEVIDLRYAVIVRIKELDVLINEFKFQLSRNSNFVNEQDYQKCLLNSISFYKDRKNDFLKLYKKLGGIENYEML